MIPVTDVDLFLQLPYAPELFITSFLRSLLLDSLGKFYSILLCFHPFAPMQPKRRNVSGMTRRRPFNTNDEARSACASAHLVSERICLIRGNVWSTKPRETGSCDNTLLGVRIITAAPEIVWCARRSTRGRPARDIVLYWA